MKPMSVKVFVDSNIWLYSLTQLGGNATDVRHGLALNFLTGLARPVINSQVIREVCRNLIKKSSTSEPRIQSLIEGWYRDCEIVNASAGQFLLASQLRESGAFSYWDSLIVAAALDAGCTTLFSEDMQHGQVLRGQLTIINPLRA
jgi:predicted nucleic acid-binding protein